MDGRSLCRRTLLGALGAGATGLSGCLGLGDPDPDCAAGGVALVLASRLQGWYVDYPATTGLFDVDGEDREGPARRLAELADEAGYTVEYYYAEDYGRGNDDEWQVELYGELDRETVERLVGRADMPDGTDITERSGTLSRGSELSWPWTPGLLDGRAQYLAERAPELGVSLPSFGPTSREAVALTETPDQETLSWLRRTLAGRGVVRARYLNVPVDDNPLTDPAVSNYVVTERAEEDPYFSGDGATLRPDGSVAVDVYTKPFFKTLWRPDREDSLALVDEARIGISLDGRRVEERPLRPAEKQYLREFVASLGLDNDRERPDPPPLVLSTLDERTALRTATLVNHPEDARFGLDVRQCGSGDGGGSG